MKMLKICILLCCLSLALSIRIGAVDTYFVPVPDLHSLVITTANDSKVVVRAGKIVHCLTMNCNLPRIIDTGVWLRPLLASGSCLKPPQQLIRANDHVFVLTPDPKCTTPQVPTDSDSGPDELILWIVLPLALLIMLGGIGVKIWRKYALQDGQRTPGFMRHIRSEWSHYKHD